MAKERDTIIAEVTGILRAKNIERVELSSYKIVRGMNAKIIAELYIYINTPRAGPRKSTNDVASISNEDLTLIYNNLNGKINEKVSQEALMELRYTLLRYWNILP